MASKLIAARLLAIGFELPPPVAARIGKTAQSVILVPCSTTKISLPNCWLDQEKVVRL